MQPAPSLQAFATRFGESIVPQWLWASLVGASGATLGFFAWYALAVPSRAAVAELALLAALVAGAAVAIAAWSEYCRFFARRTGLSLGRSLQYDAATWLPFLLLWLTFVLPPQVTHGARLLLLATALFCVAKLLIAARFNQTVREVLLDFVATRAAIIVIAELAAVIIGQRPGTHIEESQHVLLSVWGRWDAEHYIDIATRGYLGTEMAFFPLYPHLIKLVGAFAATTWSRAAHLQRIVLFRAAVSLQFDRTRIRPPGRAAGDLLRIDFPDRHLLLGGLHRVAVFHVDRRLVLLHARRRWRIAGAIGFFAALSRVEGVLLIVPFLMEWFAAMRARTASPFGVLAAGSRSVSRSTWGTCGCFGGDPLLFSHVQKHWGRHFAPPWVSVHRLIPQDRPLARPQTARQSIARAGLHAADGRGAERGFRRLRLSYSVYMALSILVPMCTASLMSMPRFALVLFPMFALFGLWGARPAVNNAYVAFSLPLLGLFTVLFADWYWVA